MSSQPFQRSRRSDASTTAVQDQAEGLRRMFAGRRQRFIPLVANPHIGFSSVMLERATSCFALAGVSVLLADCAHTAPKIADVSLLDLGACIERLDEHTGYVAARELPRAYVDARGSAAHLLPALTAAAPFAEVVLVHAEATDLARIFVGMEVRPILLGAPRDEAIKHAYAAAKLLATRAGLMTFDLLLAAHSRQPRLQSVATNLASALENFQGALLQHWTVLDPAADVAEPPTAELRHLLARQLRATHTLPAEAAPRLPLPVPAPPTTAWHTTMN